MESTPVLHSRTGKFGRTRKRLISPLSETPNRNEKPNLHLILRGCRERLRFFHISRVIFAKKLENRTVLRYNPLEVRKE